MSRPMPRTMTPDPPASHRLADSHTDAPAQRTLSFASPEQASDIDERQFAVMFRAAVNAFGGADALRAALGEKDTYLTRLVDGMNATRPVQLRWLGPLLDDRRAAAVVLGYLSERAGAEPPVFRREVTDDEIARAAVEVLAESGQMRDTFRAQIAKRLGVRVEAVRL